MAWCQFRVQTNLPNLPNSWANLRVAIIGPPIPAICLVLTHLWTSYLATAIPFFLLLLHCTPYTQTPPVTNQRTEVSNHGRAAAIFTNFQEVRLVRLGLGWEAHVFTGRQPGGARGYWSHGVQGAEALPQRRLRWAAAQAQRRRGAQAAPRRRQPGLPYPACCPSSGPAFAQGSWLHLLWDLQEGWSFRAIQAQKVLRWCKILQVSVSQYWACRSSSHVWMLEHEMYNCSLDRLWASPSCYILEYRKLYSWVTVFHHLHARVCASLCRILVYIHTCVNIHVHEHDVLLGLVSAPSTWTWCSCFISRSAHIQDQQSIAGYSTRVKKKKSFIFAWYAAASYLFC